jgi:hypothetical protein
MTQLFAEAVIETRRWRIPRRVKQSLLAVSCLLLLAASSFAAGDSPATPPCRDSVDSYAGYKLTDVRIVTPLAIKTPLSFLFGSQQKYEEEFDAFLAQMPLKKGDAFDRAKHKLIMEALFDRYSEAVVSPGERIRVAFTTFRFENCDDVARTVGLTYLVYSSEFLYHISRIFEKPNDQITRSFAPGKLANAGSLVNVANKLLPQPIVGYDRARELFAGGKADLQTKNGIIDEMAVAATGSPNSATANFNLVGSREFAAGLLSHVNWRMGYDYFDLPSDPNRVKAATGLAQIFGASKPLGRRELTFRFGASFEGGNRRSDLPVSTLDPEFAQRLGYGALKAYLGATANRGRQSWTASYGVQLSSDGDDVSLSYTKHIFDAGYRMRYLWREHFPFRLEAQFTAGAIQTRAKAVPVVERFFGGNKTRSFIDGDDWIINSAPLIRSFPQNTFNLVGLNAPFGGKNFFSANLTLSQPVWNFPAVPDEVSQEPMVREAIASALRSARTATVRSFAEDEAEFQKMQKALLGDAAAPSPPSPGAEEFKGNLVELSAVLAEVDQQLTALSGQISPPSEVLDAIDAVRDNDDGLDTIEESNKSIEAARSDPDKVKGSLRILIAGLNKLRPGQITQLITQLEPVVEALRAAQMATPAQTLNASVDKLKKINALMTTSVKELLQFGEVKPATFKPVVEVIKNKASADDIEEVVKQLGSIVAEIKTRANTIPNTGRASLLQPADVSLSKQTAIRLRDEEDTVSEFLNSQFSADTRAMLKAYKDTEDPSDQLVRALIRDLNTLISGPSLFTPERFKKVKLSEETTDLIDKNPVGPELLALNRVLLAEAFPGFVTKSRLDESLQPLDGFLKDANRDLGDLEDFESNESSTVRGAVHELVIGFGDLAPSVAVNITIQTRRLEQPLTSAGLAKQAQDLLAQGAKLSSLQKRAQKEYQAVGFGRIEQEVDRDIAYTARSIDVIFREINLVEIAPVVTFDAARIGPGTSPGFGKTHYGLGAGVRFTIVTLDFTAGYSFNLNRQPGEPRGAVLLSMTISDLFR